MFTEIRNPDYLNTNYFRFLKDQAFTYVFLQLYSMPRVVGIYNKYKDYMKG